MNVQVSTLLQRTAVPIGSPPTPPPPIKQGSPVSQRLHTEQRNLRWIYRRELSYLRETTLKVKIKASLNTFLTDQLSVSMVIYLWGRSGGTERGAGFLRL